MVAALPGRLLVHGDLCFACLLSEFDKHAAGAIGCNRERDPCPSVESARRCAQCSHRPRLLRPEPETGARRSHYASLLADFHKSLILLKFR